MYLNNKLRMENEQISTPLPVIAEKMPPKNPVRVNTIPCHIPKFGTESKVLLLCCLKQTIQSFYKTYSHETKQFEVLPF